MEPYQLGIKVEAPSEVLPPILPVAQHRNNSPLARRLGTYLYASVFPPCTAAWSDALLIFLYEQLLALMKLGPMRRASSGRDRPHSS